MTQPIGEVVHQVVGSTHFTSGEFDNENEAEVAFDCAARQSGLFSRICRQVDGFYMQPKYEQERPGCIIDRILLPADHLKKEMGWDQGPIGVEIKKSGHKLGRAVCQCLDYQRAVFDVGGNYLVKPRWVFLFPLESVGGDIESVMLQHRIGAVAIRRGSLDFRAGAMHLIWKNGEQWEVRNPPNMGNKVGSR